MRRSRKNPLPMNKDVVSGKFDLPIQSTDEQAWVHVAFGSGIKIGGGERCRRMEQRKLTNAGLIRVMFTQYSIQLVGDVHYLAFLPSLYGYLLH